MTEETEGIEEKYFNGVRGGGPFEGEGRENIGEPGSEREVITEEQEGEAEVGVEESLGENFPIAEGSHDGGRIGKDEKRAEGEVEGVRSGCQVDERKPVEVVKAATDEERDCGEEEEGKSKGEDGSGDAGGDPATAQEMLIVEEIEDQQQHQRGKKSQHGQKNTM